MGVWIEVKSSKVRGQEKVMSYIKFRLIRRFNLISRFFKLFFMIYCFRIEMESNISRMKGEDRKIYNRDDRQPQRPLSSSDGLPSLDNSNEDLESPSSSSSFDIDHELSNGIASLELTNNNHRSRNVEDVIGKGVTL